MGRESGRLFYLGGVSGKEVEVALCLGELNREACGLAARGVKRSHQIAFGGVFVFGVSRAYRDLLRVWAEPFATVARNLLFESLIFSLGLAGLDIREN